MIHGILPKIKEMSNVNPRLQNFRKSLGILQLYYNLQKCIDTLEFVFYNLCIVKVNPEFS